MPRVVPAGAGVGIGWVGWFGKNGRESRNLCPEVRWLNMAGARCPRCHADSRGLQPRRDAKK